MQPMLKQILASDPAALAPSAITVALETGDPIGVLMAELLEDAPAPRDSLAELADSIPQPPRCGSLR